MKKRHLFIVAGICLSILALTNISCNRIKNYVVPTTWLVFPLDSGKYRTYDVIDTVFTNTNPIPTRYIIKEVTGGKIDFESRIVTKVTDYRAELSNPTSFQIDNVWAMYKDTTLYAEEIRNNIRELVIKYPMYVDTNYVWEPYQYAYTNEFHNLRYRFVSLDTTVTVNGKTFQNCVVVFESERGDSSKTAIKYRKAYTVYAPNIGKIYRYYRQKDRSGSGGTINTERSGTHIETLIDHN